MKEDKSIHVYIQSLDDAMNELTDTIDNIEEAQPTNEQICFESVDSFFSFMFPTKIQLLIAIKVDQPKSLYQLAKMIDKPQSVVLRECNALERMGFITYELGERNSKAPKLAFDYDSIVLHDNRGLQKYQFLNVA